MGQWPAVKGRRGTTWGLWPFLRVLTTGDMAPSPRWLLLFQQEQWNAVFPKSLPSHFCCGPSARTFPGGHPLLHGIVGSVLFISGAQSLARVPQLWKISVATGGDCGLPRFSSPLHLGMTGLSVRVFVVLVPNLPWLFHPVTGRGGRFRGALPASKK